MLQIAAPIISEAERPLAASDVRKSQALRVTADCESAMPRLSMGNGTVAQHSLMGL